MAKYLCQTSEGNLWQIVSESCQRNDAKLQRDKPSAATIITPGFIRGAWRVRITSSEHESTEQTTLQISASLSSWITCLRRALIALGVGLCIWGIAGMREPDPDLTPLLLMIPGMLSLTAFLMVQFLASRYPKALLSSILNDLQRRVRLRSIEPFELKSPWWESHIALPLLAVVFLAHIPIVLGAVVGIAFLVPACTDILSLVVIKPRLEGWRGVLHGTHSFWTRIAITGTGPIIAATFIGTMLHCRAYHPATFRDLGTKVLSKAIVLGSIDERNWRESTVTMAKEIMETSSLSSGVQAATAIVVAMTIFLFLWSALRGVSDGMRYWDTAHLSEHSPITVTSPSAQRNSLVRWEVCLITGYALLLGATYWFLALLAVDVTAYLLFGKPLVLYFIGWSLELLKTMVGATGLPMWAAGVCVTVTFTMASLPGLAMLLTAFVRITRQVLSMLARLRPHGDQEDLFMSEYGEWVRYTSAKAGIPAPRLMIIHGGRQKIYSDCGLFPQLPGRIVISEKALAALSKPEMEALLAHEIHHLRHNAWHVEMLKLFSCVCLFPMYYFLILYDFARHEREADTFAVSATGNGEALKSALVKLYVAGSIGSTSRRHSSIWSLLTHCLERLRNRSRFLRALSLYFDDSIFTAAYPTLAERFEYIDGVDASLENSRA